MNSNSKLLSKEKILKYRTQVGLIGIAIIVLLLFMVTSPDVFLSPQIYRSFLSTVPFVGVMALGLTLILAMGEIDLSFPAVMALSGFVFALTYQLTGSVFLGMVACLLTGSFIGMLNGLLVTKIGIPAIVVTIGMQFFIRGLSNVLSQGSALNMNVGDNIFY